MKHTIVYTSANLFEIDIVRDAFKKADLPFYIQTENLAGVRTAFPVAPAAGLGTRWHVFVPEKRLKLATETLLTLHLSQDSDLHPFPVATPASLKRNLLKALILVSPILVLLVYFLFKVFSAN
jgi:hypothetical protein